MRYALFPAAAHLVGLLGCAGDNTLPAPITGTPVAQGGWMSATAEESPWNSAFVTASRTDTYLVMEGSMWLLDGGSTMAIRLTIRTNAGTEPQVIGPSAGIAGDVMYRPVYEASKGWSASGPNGSGTLTLTSLTSDRATGTFSFTAKALTPTADPPNFRVTKGHFDVRFR